MWIFYLVFIGLLLYFISQLPPQWRDPRHPDYLLWGVSLIGFTSLILLITCFYRIPNGWFRQAVLYTESAFFCSQIFTLTLCVFRQITYYPLRHFCKARFFASKKLFMGLVLACTAAFCAVGFYQMEQLAVTPYSVIIEKPCQDSTLRTMLLADLHVGAGASYSQLDRMVEAVNNADADLVILAGDIADSASSREDLDTLFAALSKLKSRYGTFYAEGNHEGQCHYELASGLDQSGVISLHDSALTLPNGLAILGRCDDRKVPISDIRHADGIADTAPCLVIQHRPQSLRRLAGTSDLILCGHTHGYQLPMCAFYFPVLYDTIDGWSQFGDTQVVTTTGVGAWGYHCTWPSKCEVAQIDITFTGGPGHEA